MLTQQHVFGRRSPDAPRPFAAIGALAQAVADRARALGLTVVRTRISKIAGSPSRHLQVRDSANRDWFIRLSDHYMPRRTGYARPHFDLVTRDGSSGAELALAFVARIARGDEAWTPPEATPARHGERPKMRRERNRR